MNSMREIWHRILLNQKQKFPMSVELFSFNWDESLHKNDKSIN